MLGSDLKMKSSSTDYTDSIKTICVICGWKVETTKQNGKIVIKKFVVGWYICQMRSASDSVTKSEDQARETFRLEIHAEPIRLALKTW